jgi:hypothetical protein
MIDFYSEIFPERFIRQNFFPLFIEKREKEFLKKETKISYRWQRLVF